MMLDNYKKYRVPIVEISDYDVFIISHNCPDIECLSDRYHLDNKTGENWVDKKEYNEIYDMAFVFDRSIKDKLSPIYNIYKRIYTLIGGRYDV